MINRWKELVKEIRIAYWQRVPWGANGGFRCWLLGHEFIETNYRYEMRHGVDRDGIGRDRMRLSYDAYCARCHMPTGWPFPDGPFLQARINGWLRELTHRWSNRG